MQENLQGPERPGEEAKMASKLAQPERKSGTALKSLSHWVPQPERPPAEPNFKTAISVLKRRGRGREAC